MQVLKLAEKAGLVKLGHVALDGTKIKANASKHKAMSYERMKKREAELQAEVDRWLEAAEAADAEEDKLYGDKRGDEMPDWVADKQKRLEKIRQAKAALEAEAKAAAEAESQRARGRGAAPRRRPQEERQDAAPPKTEPDGKAQRNFTDPESRILKTKDGYIQGYNAQAAVDGAPSDHRGADADQVLQRSGAAGAVARRDQGQSGDAIPTKYRPMPATARDANLRTLKRRRIEGYIATGRQKHGTTSATAKEGFSAGSLIARMSTKLKRAGYRSRYRLRKQIVEPVFGQIKQARGFRQFLLRGIDKVKAEWALICTAHNLAKLARAA